MKALRIVGGAFVALAVVAAAVGGAVIAFNAPVAPPPLAAGDGIPGIADWNRAEIPAPRTVKARDGVALAYRLYPGRPDRIAVVVHGSSGAGYSMHQVGRALAEAGVTAVTIDLRGHGGSGRNGDVDYKGQMDDDLVDLARGLGLDRPGVRKVLIGFSSGGGFALRTAAGKATAPFDGYVALSPYIAHDSPTVRPGAGGWAGVALPRFVALAVLDGFGLPWFQDLPVVAFATAAAAGGNRTPVYSYRLQTSMHLSRAWRADIARIARPTVLIAGASDQLFHAERYAGLMAELNPRIDVRLLPGLGHMDMIVRPPALEATVAATKRLLGD